MAGDTASPNYFDHWDKLDKAAEALDLEDKPNALQDNINRKSANSYYYGHARQATGELAAPPPVEGGRKLEVPEGATASKDGSLAEKSPYYYAHNKRDDLGPPAPMPEAGGIKLAVEKRVVVPTVETKAITNYMFLDEDDIVKVYVPLEGLSSKVTKDQVTSVFEEQSMTLTVQGYEEDKDLVLKVPKLLNEINPEDSGHKTLKNKVVITLSKAKKLKWATLK
mmetsp:Transcript_43367/g.52480  ORF Transcript_43367/g.52480 Transcript_43367/m.52480 type:complete len:223 (+) Transcript_43367:254-922(+)